MKTYILPIVALLTITACSAVPKLDEGHYWERASVSESIYMRGPKAQQILNRDIARCVTDLRELERLGQIKNAIPADYYDRIDDVAALELAKNDSPERDGALFAEQTPYHDFESCMQSNGWKRIKHVPYEVSLRAQETYRNNHATYKNREEYINEVKQDNIGLNS